jgi:hypothetical protein
MSSSGHIPFFFNGIAWQDPSILELARIILCAATMISYSTKLIQPNVCPFLALAVSFSLNSEHLSDTEKFFQSDKESRAVSRKYCGQLSELYEGNGNNLEGYIGANHANSHGIHKESARKVALGMTLPP